MMIGTVYIIHPQDERITRRYVYRSLNSETADDFIQDAANYYVNDSPLMRGYTIEFGPIGPPWRKA